MRRRHILFSCLVLLPVLAHAEGAEELLKVYQLQGATAFSAVRGERLWRNEVRHADGVRQCSLCHGTDLSKPGKHATTGKVIPPMSRLANDKALRDSAHIEKWFLRNCKWTLGRECSSQEKGDVLTYLLQGAEQ